MPRRRRRERPRHGWESYAAPVAFLVAATVAILLVRSGLHHGTATTSAPPPAAVTRTATTSASRATTAATTTSRTAAKYVVVQAGDSFGTIASRAGVTVARIEALNPGVSSTSLHIGQRIRVG